MNQIFVFEGKDKDGQGWIVQKAEMIHPDIKIADFYQYDPLFPENPDKMGFDMDGFKEYSKNYEKHLASLPRYRYSEDIPIGSELVEGKDFELRFECEFDVYKATRHWKNVSKSVYDDFAKDYRRIVAIPIKPIEQQQLSKEEAAKIWAKENAGFVPDRQSEVIMESSFIAGYEYANQKLEEYKQSNGEIERLKKALEMLTKEQNRPHMISIAKDALNL